MWLANVHIFSKIRSVILIYGLEVKSLYNYLWFCIVPEMMEWIVYVTRGYLIHKTAQRETYKFLYNMYKYVFLLSITDNFMCLIIIIFIELNINKNMQKTHHNYYRFLGTVIHYNDNLILLVIASKSHWPQTVHSYSYFIFLDF